MEKVGEWWRGKKIVREKVERVVEEVVEENWEGIVTLRFFILFCFLIIIFFLKIFEFKS